METFMDIVSYISIMVQLLMLGILCSLGFERRKYFVLRLVLSIVVCLAAQYGITALYNSISIPDNAVMTCLTNTFLYAFIFMCAGLAVCFRFRFSDLMYVGATAYCIQHFVFCVASLTGGFNLPSSPYLGLYYLGAYIVLELVIFALVGLIFYRKVNAKNIAEIGIRSTIFAVLFVLVVDILVSAFVMDEGGTVLIAYRLTDLLCCFLCLVYQYAIVSLSMKRSESKRLAEMLQNSQSQYEMSKQSVELLNIRCHDLKHALRDFQEVNALPAGLVKELDDVIAVHDAVFTTGNAALNVVLTEKSLLCSDKGITFSCMADAESMPKMEEAEIYNLFSNAMDNAIEAVSKVEDGDKKVINLTMQKIGAIYRIRMQNYVSGDVSFKGGMPQTKKKDPNHGYGTKSMRNVVERHGGKASFGCEDGVFVFNAVFPLSEEEEAQAAA